MHITAKSRRKPPFTDTFLGHLISSRINITISLLDVNTLHLDKRLKFLLFAVASQANKYQ